MEIDKQVYDLRNQLVDDAYEKSMNWIETEKYYNRLSLINVAFELARSCVVNEREPSNPNRCYKLPQPLRIAINSVYGLTSANIAKELEKILNN